MMGDDRKPATASLSETEREQLWHILGLQIARKTEIIALAAFVLSVSSILYQIFNYARGAMVVLFPSDQIVITATDKLGRNYLGQENLLALIATMAYVNNGDTGHNAIIRREYIEFSLGDRRIQHQWYEFGSSDVKDGKLTFNRDSEARPSSVAAGSAVSHETLFAAWEIVCDSREPGCNPVGNFVKWGDFLNTIATTKLLSVTTRAEIYPSKQLTASCMIHLRDWELKILQDEQWLSAACTDVSGQASIKGRYSH
jgi:hypothetical protein